MKLWKRQKRQTRSRSLRSLLQDQSGLTTVEYVIVLCLIAVVGFGLWQKFGGTVAKKVDKSNNILETGLPEQTSSSTGQ